ncbi:MAG: SAP domain-containing protein [Anaeroplasmataceae bacterium]|nr:SAP domain-containing protein [Anaeroplasmataceae bacterium]
MNRPKFDEIKSYEEFEKYYWYREELQEICKGLGLEYNANKSDLNRIIYAWFNGKKVTHKPQKRMVAVEDNLTLNTSLLKCGFTFSNQFRTFYSEITGDKNFRFTADMVATVKAVKMNKDENFTLGDLLDIKRGKKVYAKFDNSSCQWNQFLKDFCADEQNNCFKDKLKTASQFWKLLRESDLPKVYTKEFIERNKEKLK